MIMMVVFNTKLLTLNPKLETSMMVMMMMMMMMIVQMMTMMMMMMMWCNTAQAHSHNDHYDNWDYRWQQPGALGPLSI